MNRVSQNSVLILAVVLLAVPTIAVPEQEETARPQTCVHEMAFESFSGIILVSVTIGDSPPLDFVLDSGATQSSVTDPFLALALGFEIREAGLARGVGSGAKQVLIADDVHIRSDGTEILRAPLVVHDIGARLAAMSGRDIDGFLGADLFERYVVDIDPRNHRILLHDPETFFYVGDGYEVPLEVVDRRPIVEGRVVVKEGGKEVPVRLLVDTGSGRALALITRSRRRLKPPQKRTFGGSVGVVGDQLVVVASTRNLRIGSIVAERIETAWLEAFHVPAVRNIEDLNGILGNLILSRFRVVFDYRGGRLILEPHRPVGP